MHNEAKQTERLEFGATKGLLQGPSRENGKLVFKRARLLFQGRVFKGNIWDEGCSMCDFLLIAWWCSNRVMSPISQPSASNQSGVCVLLVSI